MKKYIFTLMAMMTMVVSASAMSYSQAREQALFLTDKMAYELNLNDAQYEAAYEINLDYLMGINTYDDLYGVYWTRRNMDLRYILLAVPGFLRRPLLLPPAQLGRLLLALRYLRSLSSP